VADHEAHVIDRRAAESAMLGKQIPFHEHLVGR